MNEFPHRLRRRRTTVQESPERNSGPLPWAGHFEPRTSGEEREVAVLRVALVPMTLVCVFYGMLFLWWGLVVCFGVCLLSGLVHLVTRHMLFTSDFVFSAKVLFMANWHVSVFVVTWVLTTDCKLHLMSAVMALLWTMFFNVSWRTKGRAMLVALSSLTYHHLLLLCDGSSSFLRDGISKEDLEGINRFMSPLIETSLIVYCLLFVLWLKMVNQEREEDLSKERSLVDTIINGLLPSQIVMRIKAGERLIADFRPLACVMFMDICGFTSISASLGPRQVVDGLVKVFAHVEEIVKKYDRVEKIKTVGDAFMCSSGILRSTISHEDVVAVADLALELRGAKFELRFLSDLGVEETIPIRFRFGIHCGEVVAGIISRERFTL